MKLRTFTLSVLAVSAALAVPAMALAGCDDYFAQSRAVSDDLNKAFEAMQAKDAATYTAILPIIEAELKTLPATEIKAETCADHINAYTVAQFSELSALRAHGVATGFPDDLPLVKQPDLNQLSLAYAVGWIHFEQGDLDGALAAYAKGLAMFPHSAELQNEYVATLLQLDRPEEVVTFVDKVLAGTYDLDDVARAKMYAARGIALKGEGETASAIEALTVALRYNQTDDVQAVLDSLQDGAAGN